MSQGPYQMRKPSKLRDGEEAVRRYEEQQRAGVRRAVQMGLSDRRGATVLHMDGRRFKKLREAMGLAPNLGGVE